MGHYISNEEVSAAEQHGIADPQTLISQLTRLVENPEALKATKGQKHEIKRLALAAISAVEEPFETMQRLSLSVLCACLYPWSFSSNNLSNSRSRWCQPVSGNVTRYLER